MNFEHLACCCDRCSRSIRVLIYSPRMLCDKGGGSLNALSHVGRYLTMAQRVQTLTLEYKSPVATG